MKLKTPEEMAEELAAEYADKKWKTNEENPLADRGSLHWKRSRTDFLAGHASANRWVKIEPGCELPEHGEVCLALVNEVGNNLYHKGHFIIWSYHETFGFQDYGIAPTHWKRVTPPTELPE